MNTNQGLCKKCFSATDSVVEEVHADIEGAMTRFVALDERRNAPSMCETPTGGFRVCHAAQRMTTKQQEQQEATA